MLRFAVLFACFAVLVLSTETKVPSASARAGETQKYWNDLSRQELELNRQRFQSINTKAKAKNVILFIGDGMGISTLTAARTLKAQNANVLPGHPRLYFEEFPHVGLVQTYNTDKFGPDSAGTATAYHCGVKTNLGVIAVDERVEPGNCKSFKSLPDSSIKCMAEYAADKGKSIGLVSTKAITDASPAPIYSHSADRDWQDDQSMTTEARTNGCKDIASQLVDNADYVNVALGGGYGSFGGSNRIDKRNLTREWTEKKKKAGRMPAFVRTRHDLLSVNTSAATDLLGLFASGNLMYDQDNKNQGLKEPTLKEMAIKALEIVQKNPKGYFLFIEGAKIDSAHHSNNAAHSLYETLAFEDTIAEVMKRVNTEETLVLVTADHSHVFTYGSYVSRTSPIFDPTDSSNDSKNKKFTSLLYGNGPGFAVSSSGSRPTLTATQTNSLSYKFESAVPLSSETHGAEEVAVYAKGPHAYLIGSLIEQSTIAHVMMFSACLGPYSDSDHC